MTNRVHEIKKSKKGLGIETVATFGDLPSAGSVSDGALRKVEDTGQIVESDGSSWTEPNVYSSWSNLTSTSGDRDGEVRYLDTGGALPFAVTWDNPKTRWEITHSFGLYLPYPIVDSGGSSHDSDLWATNESLTTNATASYAYDAAKDLITLTLDSVNSEGMSSVTYASDVNFERVPRTKHIQSHAGESNKPSSGSEQIHAGPVVKSGGIYNGPLIMSVIRYDSGQTPQFKIRHRDSSGNNTQLHNDTSCSNTENFETEDACLDQTAGADGLYCASAKNEDGTTKFTNVNTTDPENPSGYDWEFRFKRRSSSDRADDKRFGKLRIKV